MGTVEMIVSAGPNFD